MEQADSKPASPVKKSDEIHISRRVVIIASAALAVILALLLLWQFGGFRALGRLIAPANAQVTIIDKVTKKPIPNANVVIEEQTVRTNDQGVAELSKLRANKEYILKITSAGYLPFENKLRLKRGKNSLSFELEINQIKTTLQGTITDYVSEEPLSEVKITTDFGTATADASGKYSLADVPVGTVNVTLEKSGFEKKSNSITLEENKTVDLAMVRPEKVFFVSNRDNGKRSIYSINYDGSNVAQLVKRVDDTEDFALSQSPDGKKIVFLSTRDKRKVEGTQSFEPYLYVIDTDGKNLNLISKDFYISSITWSSNSQHLAWTAKTNATDEAYQLFLFALGTKQQTKLSESGSTTLYKFNHKGTSIAWVQSNLTGSPDANTGTFYREIGKGDVKEIDNNNANELIFTEDDKSLQYNYYDDQEKKTKYIQYTLSNGTKSTYTPGPGTTSTKIISPDGSKYAYIVSRDGKSDVYMSDASGKNEKRLTELGTAYGQPEWSQGARYIIFDSYRTAETAKYVVSTNGKTPKKISDIYLEVGPQGEF